MARDRFADGADSSRPVHARPQAGLVCVLTAALSTLAAHEAHADPPTDAVAHRATAYAASFVLLASSHALEAQRDASRTLWLAGLPSLEFPVLTATNDGSAWLGLAALGVGGGTELAGALCDGGCRTALRVGGLAGYVGLAATDLGWFANRPSGRYEPPPLGRNASRWYGWGPLVAYGALLGGVWLATIDEAGVAGAGFVLAGTGLTFVPVSHFGAGRRAHGWVAFGGTLLGAGAGALAACASGCDSAYAQGPRAIFEPGRALVGASAGIATWAVLDVALFSYRDEPAATRPGSAIEPYVTASPTTGRPRVGAAFAF
jgi:hypothetical protein